MTNTTLKLIAASTETDAVQTIQNNQQMPFNETTDIETQLETEESSLVINFQNSVYLEITYDLVGQIRTIRKVAIAELLDPMTKRVEGYALFVFGSPDQAQAFAKRIRRKSNQMLDVGDRCKQVLFIYPDHEDSNMLNDVISFGVDPKEFLFLTYLLPAAEGMDSVCETINNEFAHLFP